MKSVGLHTCPGDMPMLAILALVRSTTLLVAVAFTDVPLPTEVCALEGPESAGTCIGSSKMTNGVPEDGNGGE